MVLSNRSTICSLARVRVLLTLLQHAKRAERLAYRAVTAMKDATAIHGSRVIGWIGVDLILGDREDGRDDRVLEINPRITTSIVGLVELSHSRLIAVMTDSSP